jgi:hypothetical protein
VALFGLLADDRAAGGGQIGVEGRGQTNRRGHRGCEIIFAIEIAKTFAHLLAHAHRTVVHPQIGNVQPGCARGCESGLGVDHPHFLLDGQARKQIRHPRVCGFCVVKISRLLRARRAEGYRGQGHQAEKPIYH